MAIPIYTVLPSPIYGARARTRPGRKTEIKNSFPLVRSGLDDG